MSKIQSKDMNAARALCAVAILLSGVSVTGTALAALPEPKFTLEVKGTVGRSFVVSENEGMANESKSMKIELKEGGGNLEGVGTFYIRANYPIENFVVKAERPTDYLTKDGKLLPDDVTLETRISALGGAAILLGTENAVLTSAGAAASALKVNSVTKMEVRVSMTPNPGTVLPSGLYSGNLVLTFGEKTSAGNL